MHARTLIVAPVAILATALLVGAVIDAGRATREQEPAASRTTLADDPVTIAERDRIRSLLASTQQCETVEECSGAAMAARLDVVARRIDGWPEQPRFRVVRHALQLWLAADADLLTALEAVDADDVRTISEERRLAQLADARHDAAVTVANARRAARIDDDRAHAELVHAADAARQRLLRADAG